MKNLIKKFFLKKILLDLVRRTYENVLIMQAETSFIQLVSGEQMIGNDKSNDKIQILLYLASCESDQGFYYNDLHFIPIKSAKKWFSVNIACIDISFIATVVLGLIDKYGNGDKITHRIIRSRAHNQS